MSFAQRRPTPLVVAVLVPLLTLVEPNAPTSYHIFMTGRVHPRKVREKN